MKTVIDQLRSTWEQDLKQISNLLSDNAALHSENRQLRKDVWAIESHSSPVHSFCFIVTNYQQDPECMQYIVHCSPCISGYIASC